MKLYINFQKIYIYLNNNIIIYYSINNINILKYM